MKDEDSGGERGDASEQVEGWEKGEEGEYKVNAPHKSAHQCSQTFFCIR